MTFELVKFLDFSHRMYWNIMHYVSWPNLSPSSDLFQNM